MAKKKPAARGEAEVREVPLSELIMDADTQVRVAIDEGVAEEYAAMYREGGKDALPPIDAVETDAGEVIPWDGFHRACGAETAGLSSIMVRVTPGARDDARWLAISANKRHGLKRSNADKRRAAEMAVRMRPELSDRLLAEHAGVSFALIASARKQVQEYCTSPPADAPAASPAEPPTRTGKDGKAYPVRPKPAAPKDAEPPAPPAERQPGDDTDVIAAEDARVKAGPKNGQPAYAWRQFEDAFGPLLRQIDALGRCFGVHESPRADELRRRLSEFFGDFERWYKALTGKGRAA